MQCVLARTTEQHTAHRLVAYLRHSRIDLFYDGAQNRVDYFVDGNCHGVVLRECSPLLGLIDINGLCREAEAFVAGAQGNTDS